MGTRISRKVNGTPVFSVGAGGNYYVYCSDYKELEKVCINIGKALSSIYYNERHKCYAIRAKLKSHKRKIKELMRTP